jgi:uncharacterized protein (DUF2252 family)
MAEPTSTEPHPTVEERIAAGKAARAEVPRSSHADWSPSPDRPDPVALLESQGATRVPDLVPIRYGRMSASAFAYYRGAALPMASDLSTLPRVGLTVQLCGDAHLSNFGGFASPDRALVFDINDFDETNPGPFDWDLKRLAASFEIAGRSIGLADKVRRSLNRAVGRAYRVSMEQFAGMSNLDVWYARMDLEVLTQHYGADVGKSVMKRLERNIAKAKSKDRLKAAAKLTREVDGRLEFISDPPLLVPIEEVFSDVDSDAIEEIIRGVLHRYRDTLSPDRRRLLDSYEYLRVARKVVGVGSVGTRAWVVLLMGRDHEDPLFLQVKEAQASVLEEFTGVSEYASSGQRVVEGQRLMQASSDIFLGYDRVGSPQDGGVRDFYMRQLWDWKASADVETMAPEGLTVYAHICGWTLARAHARSGDRVAISAYLGRSETFDRALAEFAVAYADQNDRDHQALVAAIEQGRVQARTGI